MNTESFATFAAGCFWGVQELFDQLPGVTESYVGYTGGHTERPTYKEVCSDTTGHAEAVELAFDPNKITYEQLLALFWKMHDPTTKNKQGPDIGSQYRSVIFYSTPEQKEAAEASLKEEQKKYTQPIVTEILPATTFWKAEEYHQKYNKKNGVSGCHI